MMGMSGSELLWIAVKSPGEIHAEIVLAERFFWTSRLYIVASTLSSFDLIAQGRTSRGWTTGVSNSIS